MAMKPEIKQKWVAALRSGEFVQGTERLKFTSDESDYTEYCCLGVLTELFAKEHNTGFTGTGIDLKQIEVGGGVQEFLCTEVMEWAGVVGCNPEVTYQGNVACLSELNDGKFLGAYDDVTRLNFNQIADLIEAQL